MKLKIPYLQWRAGRPRWEPGPGLRAKGWKGRDLKSDSGEWLALDRAIEAARQLNDEVAAWRANGKRRQSPPAPRKSLEVHLPQRPKRPYRGYVYFARSGCGNFVKIGYSLQPEARIKQFQGWGKVTLIATVEAPRHYEKTLHQAFAPFREYGEWFRMNEGLDRFVGYVKLGSEQI